MSQAINCTLDAFLNCTVHSNMTLTNSTETATTPRPIIRLPPAACDAPTQADYIGQAAFLIIILVVTFLGNFLVCVSVVVYRRLRTVTNFFVISLAASDLLISLLSLPFRIDQTLHNFMWCSSMAMCQTWYIVDFLSTIASVWNLVLISIDRFMAIVHPFHYHTYITKRNAGVLFALVWLNAAVWAFTSLLNWTNPGQQTYFTNRGCQKYDPVYYTAMSAAQFFLPLLIIIVMYGNVFRVAMNHARAVAAQQTGGNRRGRRSSISIIREMKAAKTLAIVIGAFNVCWLPFFVIVLIAYWSTAIQSFSTNYPAAWKAVYFIFTFILPTLNSTLNPIIYAVFNRDFRAAFKKLLNQFFGAKCNSPANQDQSLATYATYTSVYDAQSKNRNGEGKTARFEVYDPSGETDPVDQGGERENSTEDSNRKEETAGSSLDDQNNEQKEHKLW